MNYLPNIFPLLSDIKRSLLSNNFPIFIPAYYTIEKIKYDHTINVNDSSSEEESDNDSEDDYDVLKEKIKPSFEDIYRYIFGNDGLINFDKAKLDKCMIIEKLLESNLNNLYKIKIKIKEDGGLWTFYDLDGIEIDR